MPASASTRYHRLDLETENLATFKVPDSIAHASYTIKNDSVTLRLSEDAATIMDILVIAQLVQRPLWKSEEVRTIAKDITVLPLDERVEAKYQIIEDGQPCKIRFNFIVEYTKTSFDPSDAFEIVTYKSDGDRCHFEQSYEEAKLLLKMVLAHEERWKYMQTVEDELVNYLMTIDRKKVLLRIVNFMPYKEMFEDPERYGEADKEIIKHEVMLQKEDYDLVELLYRTAKLIPAVIARLNIKDREIADAATKLKIYESY